MQAAILGFGVFDGGRRISRLLLVGTLALYSVGLGIVAQPDDVRGPIAVSATSPDGWIIGVCFDKPLTEASATNVANYSLSDSSGSGFAIASAMLRPDFQSVTLRLESRYTDPFRVPWLRVTNVVGLDGLSTPSTNYVYVQNFTATDVGTLGTDPKEPGGFFTCRLGEFEMVSSGSGWEGTNDGFYLVHQAFDPEWDFIYYWQVSFLEAANKDSSVGLMIREDVSPGSRFLAVCVTPTDEAARDGSGPGSALVKVLYRSQPDEVPTEVSGTRSIKAIGLTNLWIEFSRWRNVNTSVGWEKRLDVGWINRIGGNYEVLAEVNFALPLTQSWRIGFAATSHNNDAGFSSRSVSSIQYSYYDPPPPPVEIRRAGADLNLSWTEFEGGPSWRLVSSSILTGFASWQTVTNAVVRVPGPFYFTNSVSVHLDLDTRYFRLMGEIP